MLSQLTKVEILRFYRIARWKRNGDFLREQVLALLLKEQVITTDWNENENEAVEGLDPLHFHRNGIFNKFNC